MCFTRRPFIPWLLCFPSILIDILITLVSNEILSIIYVYQLYSEISIYIKATLHTLYSQYKNWEYKVCDVAFSPEDIERFI